MALPFTVPPEHHVHLHAIQTIVFNAAPVSADWLPTFRRRRQWRENIHNSIQEWAQNTPDVVVLAVGIEFVIVIESTFYRLGSLWAWTKKEHVDPMARLRTNKHSWLLPAWAQQLIKFEAGVDPVPGDFDMPVPILFDPVGIVFVGWPDVVTSRGVGWGVQDAIPVHVLPLHVPSAKHAPAPHELVPPIEIPELKNDE